MSLSFRKNSRADIDESKFDYGSHHMAEDTLDLSLQGKGESEKLLTIKIVVVSRLP
jgi:hypothetical protein